jgi:predicted phosphohydrolase
MIQIRYLSDLHLEFINSHQLQQLIQNIPSGFEEICILAGDIGNPYQPTYDIFMNFINDNFKKTFVISGNHEYYNKTKTIQETNDFMKKYFLNFKNISFLNNNYELYDTYCFIGTTLWSKITVSEYKINDVYQIPHLDFIEYNRLNMEGIYFLEDTIKNNENCIIITHHVPSESLINVKYKTIKMRPYNQWFYCNMDSFIENNKYKIKCWIYGHTHTPSTMILHGIPFLCNPIGYPNENEFSNFQLTITLD